MSFLLKKFTAETDVLYRQHIEVINNYAQQLEEFERFAETIPITLSWGG
jgi:hypothetical protein